MSNRIILLTGASSGIGNEIARQLARKGDFPILVSRNAGALRSLKEELGCGEWFTCDVTRQDEVESLTEEVVGRFNRVDVLINNAGYGRFGGAMDIPIADYAGMVETNYLGAVRMTQALLPHLLRQGNGRIVNIASVAGLTGIPNLAAYCASKFALIGYSESLHMEFAPGIRVGILCPGPVKTPFFKGEDPSRLFPAPIARQLLDAATVARHAVRLIDRPRVKIIPRSMGWAMRIHRFTPGLYRWAAKKMYDSFKERSTPPCTSFLSTPSQEKVGENGFGNKSKKY